MTETQKEKLDNLKGRIISYQAKEYNFQDYKNNHGTVVIFTKQRTFNFLTSEIDSFLESIYTEVVEKAEKVSTFKKETTVPQVPVAEKVYKTSLAIYEPTESQKTVNNTLLEMLQKVKEDPGAIPQARAVCEIANTMVNMEKSQIQLMNLARKSR